VVAASRFDDVLAVEQFAHRARDRGDVVGPSTAHGDHARTGDVRVVDASDEDGAVGVGGQDGSGGREVGGGT
jgi:hypothetical protein